MDRETLLEAIASGPIRVTMNDGKEFDIPSSEFAIVDSTAAHVLTRDEDGKMRARILALVCMAHIQRLATAE